jgi:septal ring-binding cell division protein DamX
LRLLYNLQVGNHKLMHIVLVGQPELNDKLNQPNMRQLKDRIIHHFSMLPLSQNIIESYLLFRMRTAGYRGPSPFSVPAATLIGKASQGLMRRVNILADKSLLAAFVDNTHGIEVRHVQAAIRDTELDTASSAWWKRKNTLIAAGITAAAVLIAGVAWFLGSMHANPPSNAAGRINTPIVHIAPATEANTVPANPPANEVNEVQDVKLHMSPTLSGAPATDNSNTGNNAPASANPPAAAPETPEQTLLEKRIAAAKKKLSHSPPGSASIQLYYTDNVRPARIEAFLKRADTQGTLDNIYIFPIKINGRRGYRVLYGVYASSEKARSGIRQLPQRFQESFAPTILLLEDLPAS